MKFYTTDKTWVRVDDEEAVVGLTAEAADEIGAISYIELPDEETDVIQKEPLGIAESIEKTMRILAPVSGTIVRVNRLLDDDPEIINRSPEEKGWLCKLENIDLAELDDMMDEEAYEKSKKKKKKKKS